MEETFPLKTWWSRFSHGCLWKTSLKLKCVCKPWYGIITSSHFISKHLNNYYNNINNGRLLAYGLQTLVIFRFKFRDWYFLGICWTAAYAGNESRDREMAFSFIMATDELQEILQTRDYEDPNISTHLSLALYQHLLLLHLSLALYYKTSKITVKSYFFTSH